MTYPNRAKRPNHSKVCVLCGKNPATTRDHLPPDGVFYKPIPAKSNLITVPACVDCNTGSSISDESFQAFLALHVGHKSDSGIAYFEQKGRKILLANKSMLQGGLIQFKPVIEIDGSVSSKSLLFKWDKQIFDRMISRLIRGLYWHHTREILPIDVNLEIQWQNQVPKEVVEQIRSVECENAGIRTIGEQFVYCFMIRTDQVGHSVWVFQFHQSLWATGFTIPHGYVIPQAD